MRRKCYLKNVKIILKDRESISEIGDLADILSKENISMEIFSAEDDLKSGVECESKSPNIEWRELLDTEEMLYITDSKQLSEKLRKQNLAVLGWLHGEGDALPGLEYVMECPEELDIEYLDRVYRRYRQIPWEILETERCVIRETTVEDADCFFEIYSQPEIVRYTEGLHADIEQEKAYIRDYIEKVYRYFEFGTWTVLWKATGEIIGRAGLAVREGYELPDLGFIIAKPWQRKGIAYEICSAILQYGKEKLGFERVQTLVLPENEASMKLCRKLGLVETSMVQENGKEYCLLVKEL